MKKHKFIEELKSVLEIQDQKLSEETNLKELESYDSLSAIAIIAYVDENFNKKLNAAQLQSVNTVTSLMKLIGSDHFE